MCRKRSIQSIVRIHAQHSLFSLFLEQTQCTHQVPIEHSRDRRVFNERNSSCHHSFRCASQNPNKQKLNQIQIFLNIEKPNPFLDVNEERTTNKHHLIVRQNKRFNQLMFYAFYFDPAENVFDSIFYFLFIQITNDLLLRRNELRISHATNNNSTLFSIVVLSSIAYAFQPMGLVTTLLFCFYS